MKRLILLLGIGWSLIYVINHMLLPSLPSNTKTEVATGPEPISTDRRIDSWGAYLPQLRSVPDAHRPTPPSHLRQSQEVAALKGNAEKSDNETASMNSAKTTQQVRRKRRLVVWILRRCWNSRERHSARRKRVRVPPANKGQVAQATTDQNPGWRVGSERKRRGVGLFMFAPPGF